MPIDPSDEQQKVIDALSNNSNPIVDSCAGSGKTTTIAFCAEALKSKKFCLLTFNKSLKDEVSESFRERKIDNVEVYTYHGLAVKFYDSYCNNDIGIRKVLRNDTEPRKTVEYDIIVLDEVQDMTKLYFNFLWKFLLNMNHPVLLMLLGDEKQSIYEFKGADSRFLTMAEKCWSDFPLLSSGLFVYCTLHTSYRITNEMSLFINEGMLGQQRIKACKPGPKVTYVKRKSFQIPRYVQAKIEQLMLNDKSHYGEIMILYPASTYYIAKDIENRLVEMGMPCYFPSQDNEQLNSKLIQNKIAFSSYHGSKGRQRQHIFLLGYDLSYFQYYSGKNKDPKECPNELYVAASRGISTLYIFHNESKNMVPFMKLSQNEMKWKPYMNFQGTPTTANFHPVLVQEQPDKKPKKDVTTFTRFISEDTLDKIAPILDEIFEVITEAHEEDVLEIPCFHETYNKNVEEVSDLNGTILPIVFNDRLREEQGLQKTPILQMMIQTNICESSNENWNNNKKEENSTNFLMERANLMPSECETISHYLYLSCLYSATCTKTYSRLKQIPLDDYTWLDDDTVEKCIERLRNTIGTDCSTIWQPEYIIIRGDSDDDHMLIDKLLSPYTTIPYRFAGRADYLTDDAIWELKCTNQLTIEHKLQVIMYAWLYLHKGYGVPKKKEKEFHLFNYKTNEHLRLCATREQLTSIVVEIIKGKQELEKLSNEEFLNQLHKPV
jgi:hypothetical protein